MNKHTPVKSLLTFLSFAALTSSAFAVTPTVTFQGEVTSQTCSASINGDTNSVVLLPTVSTTDFGATLANGQTAGLTPFTITVSGCTAPTAGNGPQLIKTRFLGFDVDSNSGVLGNRATTDAATGYGIQLTTTSDGSTSVMLSGVTDVAGLSLPEGETSTSHTFGAQYYVTDAGSATPGAITAVAEYTLSYL